MMLLFLFFQEEKEEENKRKSRRLRIGKFIKALILLSYMVEIVKMSSKGQVVIPMPIREKLGLEEGNALLVLDSKDSICMKKLEIPKIKSWKKATKPFREAARKSGFAEEDLKRIIEESKLR